jgi:H+/Cl- antiporter ClcA
MTANLQRKRIVPIVLGLVMLAVVVAAGLSPNAGVVQAQTNYGYYGQSSSSTVSPWVYLGVALVVIVAGLLLAFFLLRRRRPPAASTPTEQPVQKGSPPPSTPPEATAPVAPAAAAATPAVVKTAQDVGRVPTPVSVAAAGPAGAVAGEEPYEDIDTLIAKLYEVSGELLRRGTTKGAAGKDTGTDDESVAHD